MAHLKKTTGFAAAIAAALSACLVSKLTKVKLTS